MFLNFFHFFSMCSWFISELKIDTKTILSHKMTQTCRLIFVQQKFRHEVWRLQVSAKNTFFHFSQKNSFICLVLSSKYPHLRLDKFTKLWALEHNEFLTHSADHWTFLLVPKRDMASRLCFFFADFVTSANFSKLWGKFLETRNRYGHHYFNKSCARS